MRATETLQRPVRATRLRRARRGTGQQASPRRGAFSGLKNNSATAPSSPPGASPPLRCAGDCCFRKTLSDKRPGPQRPLAPSSLHRVCDREAASVPSQRFYQHRTRRRRTLAPANAAAAASGAASGQPLPLRHPYHAVREASCKDREASCKDHVRGPARDLP